MTQFDLASVAEHGLSMGPDPSGQAGHVRMSGTGETDGVEVLRVFLRNLHQAALASELSQVVVDLEELKFINSSCLKAMVAWIYEVDTTGRPYRIRLLRDARMHWQKGSLDTLRRLAPEVVEVQESRSR